MLCLPGFGTHANSQNLPHFRVFPASPAKTYYIHNFFFGINFPKNLQFSYKKYFGGINFPKITDHVLVCDSENYKEKLFGNYFLGKSHFSDMK